MLPLRRRLRTVHRWLGWTLGIAFAFQGLTGAAIVFKDECDRALHPALFGPLAGGPWLAPEALLGTLRSAYARRGVVTELILPDRRGESATAHVTLNDGTHGSVAVDPSTGHVYPARIWEGSLVGTVYDLHNLFYFGSAGYRASGVLGVVFGTLVVLGVVVSWPASGRWRALLARPPAGVSAPLARRHQHRRLGLVIAPLLGVSIVTGIWISLGDLARPWLAGHGLIEGRLDQPPAGTRGSSAAVAAMAVLDAARSALPGHAIAGIRLPEGGGTWTVLLRADPAQAGADARVYVDAGTGRVLGVVSDADLPPLERFWQHGLYALHNGSALGWPHRLLVFGAGLAPTVLLVLALASRVRSRRGAAAAGGV